MWIGLKPSRIGLLTVLVLAALLFETATEQGRDVLLEYALEDLSADYSRPFWFYAATFAVAAMVWITCWVSSAFRFEKEEDVLLQYRRQFPRSPLVKGSKKARADAEQRVANIYRVREWAPRFLGILVPIIVAAGFVVFAGKDGIDNAFICLGLALLLAVVILPFLRATRKVAQWSSEKNLRPLAKTLGFAQEVQRKLAAKDPMTDWADLKERLRGHVLLPILVVWVVASVIIAAAWPLTFGALFGPFPVAMLALTVLLLIGTGVAMLNRVSNLPWFLVLAFATLALSFLDVHRVRFLDNTEEAVRGRATASDLLSEFAASDEDRNSPRPIVFVATAGGGSRAAYWTASVLGELSSTIPTFNKRLFLISGVSGGSVGALFYRAALAAAPDDGTKIKEIAKAAASGDFLSPLLASMFIRDLIPGLPLSDRAEALERAWSGSFDQACGRMLNKEPSGKPKPCPVSLEEGFLKLWKSGPRWPALVLNGTVVETGGRAVASSLRLDCNNGPNCYVADIADIMRCEKRDLVASSAADVSARFPVIGPSGTARIDEEGTVRSVVDGGYFDNFGAVTLTQIMADLEPAFRENKLVPIVIQITSDPDFSRSQDGWRGEPYAGTSGPGGHQLFMPMRTMMNLRGALGRQAFVNLEAQAKRMGGAYFHFGQCMLPAGHSTHAPLGWLLSDSSRQLLDAYSAGQCGNAGQIEAVKACLESPGLGCDQTGKREKSPG
ncbi:hypothetical protein [Methyloceanibacter sp.]|uniref:hypothetical protein n=1 Tax=Methyloceanibacter sp. TaxID=1965321 RepID=UPI003D6C7929